MARRTVPAALLGALAPLAMAACMDQRDRLTPPSLAMELPADEVLPGTQLVVRLGAEDENGIIYVSARLRCAETDSLLARHTRSGVPRAESYVRDYLLDVPSTVPANSLLVVEAVTIDDQNFTTELRDTIVARVPGVPHDQPPAAPRCYLSSTP